MRTFHLVSLGCPKNLVDSEVVYGLLEKNGWKGVDEPGDGDVLLVNTCGFIQSAVEESIEEILSLSSYKEQSPEKKLAVIGCLVQRYRSKLENELPEVDIFVGTEGVADIHRLLDRLFSEESPARVHLPESFLMDATLPRSLSTPFFRAWLKITEGCNNHCSYCMIPSIRGRLRSRSIEDLVAEAQSLEQRGVIELSLIAQDLTAFGNDLSPQEPLSTLLTHLLARTTIPWIRLMYLYPSGITDELIDLVARSPRILPYMDIPLQHISNSILKGMNRRYSREGVVRLLDKIRIAMPEVALRTTFLLGFPGETRSDVADLKDFLHTARFDHVGVFAYANEEGCPAELMSEQIDESEKNERVEQVLSEQSAISARNLQRYIGKTEAVLVEGTSPETDLLLAGRTRFQAPEIDGCVLINEGKTNPGEIVNVEITEAQVYDLVGRIT
jgi:ribosomal protein S12 methylthiotransferase